MITDDDEDTHFCLKCHTTILGLDNYVNHRKSGCSSKELSKSPLPSHLLPDASFGLKADDFFSSLELQSSAKKSVSQTSTSPKNFGILTRSKTTAVLQALNKDELTQSKLGQNVWIGGHQLKLGHGDNQSKLIKAVANLERRKDDLDKVDMYEDSEIEFENYDYEDDKYSSDEDAPPRNHTGGKWKPSSPISWDAPPPSYTGGKWKPFKRSSPPPNHTKGKWKPPCPLSPKESYDYPPANFTGSKWTASKFKEYDQRKTESKDSNIFLHNTLLEKKPLKITDESPLRKSSGKVQYWCTPCNRRLTSKVVYGRHLKSELHYKNILREQEFDDNRVIENPILARSSSIAKKRNRKKVYVRCQVCKSKVNINLMGKHLISHYHCRRGNITSAVAQQMVLDNFHSIVLQSPYQCGVCKFYFNQERNFLEHWISDYHTYREQIRPGIFWCLFCKSKCNTSRDMYDHLISSAHKEVVAVINRSVPIIIKKINPVKCEQCDEEFLLNLQLILHCKREGHTFTLINQGNFECSCGRVFKSEESLKKHKIANHKMGYYFCTPCKKNFNNPEDARHHRSTTEHRYFASSKIKEKDCRYCKSVLPNFMSYKTHLKSTHPEFCPKCPKCGDLFSIPQELTSHIRLKACKIQNFELHNSCDKCSFSCSSTAELLFHKALHTEPLTIQNGNNKLSCHYKCSLCEKLFPKLSLLAHLRTHTSERPYICQVCHKGFTSKSNWNYHYKNHTEGRVPRKVKATDRSFLCSTCGASFKKKFILQQHMTIHTGKHFKCPEKECLHAARSQASLKTHMKSHTHIKNFECNICDYKGKTKQQLHRHCTTHAPSKTYNCSKCSFSGRTISHLKRHLRVHSGSKPYRCPYCEYKCNNLENLRKHILSTNKHPDKCIYECKFCSNFQSNFAKIFKDHLILQHRKEFPNTNVATTYIAGIYDEIEDNLVDATNSLLSTKPKVLVLQKTDISSPISQESQDLIVTACSSSKDVVDEILPLFIVPKNDGTSIENLPESWNLIGNYDVEESGALVPFTSDNEVLFEEHF